MLKIFLFACLLALATSGAVRTEPRSASNPVKFGDQQPAEEKVMSPYGTTSGSLAAKPLVIYKPMKFDSSSGGAVAAASAPHPYSYDSAPAGSFALPTFSEGPAYHYGGKTAYDSPHKFGGKLELHNSLFRPDGPWKKILRVLTAAIPIGLFLAALPPNIVHINATQNVKPLGTMQKQRSTDDGPVIESFPVLEMIEKRGGLRALEDGDCEANLFCEIARLGRDARANSVQQGFWAVANETPDALADLLNVKELFKAIRTDACDMYKCPKMKKN